MPPVLLSAKSLKWSTEDKTVSVHFSNYMATIDELSIYGWKCLTNIANFLFIFVTGCLVLGGLHAGLLYFTGLGCLLSAYFRIRMVQMYNLPNDPVINILVHLVCEPCALCQEYRELQAHGFNMQLGNVYIWICLLSNILLLINYVDSFVHQIFFSGVGWRNQSPEIQQSGGVMVPPTVPGGMSRWKAGKK